MRCDELDAIIEAVADGSLEPSAEQRAHLASCRQCAGALERARAIERWLRMREAVEPPASFTATVMARLGEESWRAERVFDLGFNLAVAAGLLVIAVGAAGLAWSQGLFAITIDVAGLLAAGTSQVDGGVIGRLQTVAMAAALLTTALGLWWWAEGASD